MKLNKNILFVLALICSGYYAANSEAIGLETMLQKEVKNFFEKGTPSIILKNIIQELDLKTVLLEDEVPEGWSESKASVFCATCATVVNEVIRMNSSDTVASLAISFCLAFGIGTEVVCEGMVNADEPEIWYILQTMPDPTGKDVCGIAFESRGCTSNNPDRIWEITLSNTTKPPVNEPSFPDPSNVTTLKVLHLSDTHYDPYYLPNSNANCPDEYFCCRAESGPIQSPGDAAGFWGDYRHCDLPKWTLEALYAHINQTHPDIDFILWTGDLVPHNVWNTTREGNIAIIQEMADLILEYFPGIPVYPAVGNHESNPVDQFSQPYIDDPEFEMSWLYDELANIWGVWLPSETSATIAYAAFYSTLIKPGLRILSMNTNLCSTNNWWLILDSVDIAGELQRLADELQKAEDAGENVYIISHHPPHSCFEIWSHQYNLIVSRYESTITGLFYGHSHDDKLQLFFDPDDPDRVYEVGYIGPSQTTYDYLNPGYKLFTVEGDFQDSKYRVLNEETWIIELDVANVRNYTEVIHLYSALEDYGLPDLSPQSWLDLVYEMNEANSTLFYDFHRNMVKGATPSLACDDSCKHGELCGLLNSDSSVSYCYKLNS